MEAVHAVKDDGIGAAGEVRDSAVRARDEVGR